jgi:O-acetyl-ADP-ribose deacetylase (regulator of RNase III)
VIRVVIGELAAQTHEGLVRTVRSDLSPATAASRDVLQRAGVAVAERLQPMGPIPVGGAVITPAGELASSFLIHVVTSSDDEPESPASVRKALLNGLRRAAEWGLRSLAVPALGTGAGTMDYEEAARALIEVLREHAGESPIPDEIAIVVRGEYEAEVFGGMVESPQADPLVAEGGERRG